MYLSIVPSRPGPVTTSAISVVYSLRKADEFLGAHPLGDRREALQVGEEERHLAALAAEREARGVGEDLLDDLRRDVARERPGDEALVLALRRVAPDGGADHREQDRDADRPRIEEPAGAVGGGQDRQAPSPTTTTAAPGAGGHRQEDDGGGDERRRREGERRGDGRRRRREKIAVEDVVDRGDVHLETRRGGGQRRRLQVEEPRRRGADDHVRAAEGLGRNRGRLALRGGERGSDDVGRRVAPVVAALAVKAHEQLALVVDRDRQPAEPARDRARSAPRRLPRANGANASPGTRRPSKSTPTGSRRTTPSASGRRVTEPIPAAASRSAGSGGETPARRSPAGVAPSTARLNRGFERAAGVVAAREGGRQEHAAVPADARRELRVRLLPPRRVVVEEDVEDHRRRAAARAVLQQRVVEAARPRVGDGVALEVVEARLVDLDQHDPPVGAPRVGEQPPLHVAGLEREQVDTRHPASPRESATASSETIRAAASLPRIALRRRAPSACSTARRQRSSRSATCASYPSRPGS